LTKYTYKPVKSVIEKSYMEQTGIDIYKALGNVDFDKIKVIVEADDIYESESIRKGVTDIRMWDLESEV